MNLSWREKREKFIFYEGGRGGGYVLLAREKEGEEKGEYLLFFKLGLDF